MTIDELISELQRRKTLNSLGGNLRVEITWEGIFRDITLDTIYFGKWDHEDRCLLIDADSNSYKEKFQHPDDIKNNPDGKPWDWLKSDELSEIKFEAAPGTVAVAIHQSRMTLDEAIEQGHFED